MCLGGLEIAGFLPLFFLSCCCAVSCVGNKAKWSENSRTENDLCKKETPSSALTSWGCSHSLQVWFHINRNTEGELGLGILPTSNHIFLKQTLRSFSDLFILFITLSFSPFSLPGKIFVITAEFMKGFGSIAAIAESTQLKLHSHTSAEQELADERQKKTQHPWLRHSHTVTHTHTHTHS